jgi:hypothetical protein
MPIEASGSPTGFIERHMEKQLLPQALLARKIVSVAPEPPNAMAVPARDDAMK